MQSLVLGRLTDTATMYISLYKLPQYTVSFNIKLDDEGSL